jgi:hypothetical protein
MGMKEGKDVELVEAYFKILSWHSPRQGSQENITTAALQVTNMRLPQ